MKNIIFYSDGSSDNRVEKNAGWASVYLPVDETRKPIIYYGHLETPSTNNHGELIGVIGCMFMMAKLKISNRDVITDSQYAIGCLDLNSSWNPAKNIDLIDLGGQFTNIVTPNFKWVKGHRGETGNELADKFAGYGRAKMVVNDPRYHSSYFQDKNSILETFKQFLLTKGQ